MTAKLKKIVFTLGEHTPFIVAMGLAVWCMFNDRAELGMGYLILGMMYGFWKELQETKDAIKELKKYEQPQEVEAPASGRHHSKRADY